MLFACWSAKGGAGVSVIAAALASIGARSAETLLVDLGGDQPPLLGLSSSPPGLTDWLWAEAEVPADALARLEVPVTDSWRLLALGCATGRAAGALPLARRPILVESLLRDRRTVVVDCGRPLDGRGNDDDPVAAVAAELAACATSSLLVIRPCYLALRRATLAPVRPSALIVLEEPGRPLRAQDASDVLGVSVAATVPVEPSIARAVDAGLFAQRRPRALDRALRHVA